ncbi:Xaa-Pro peptidase family protein [Bradyrhizobium sp. NP1]|uniref:M24 family metallopeptidase n=1 Tax=Bradyrhizobium sp. NP1 TaxID=3049772 RepID=UPI0025A6566A|nr:Xaa-Pro peptidase family protein [Bradyrhizobium sp. NP1]WJR80875.1 Xaa-Pro peptidase family protein [Bradyrhizobium sp. NP1]
MLLNSGRLFEGMKKESLAAIVATMPENVTYSSGFWAMSQWIRRGPQAYVLTPAAGHGDPVVIASTGLVDLAADPEVWVKDVRCFGKFIVDRAPSVELDAHDTRIESLLAEQDGADAVAVLVKAIKDRGLQNSRIGVDEIGILPQYWDKLADALPGATLVRAADVFRYARAIKTPEEIARLRKSAQIADLSISAALAVARQGSTEMDLARAFHTKTIVEGGLPVLGCIGVGTRSAMTNVQPGEWALRNGDVIRFDVGGRYKHYRADIARNGILGEPSEKLRRYHKAICAGLDRAIAMIKPGVRAADVFNAAVETVRREGISHYQRSHVGHGIGLDGYDAPNIAPSSNDVFEEGMVICVETPYYEMGFAGLQVEDTLVVTKDGVDSFMISGTELRVL